MKIVLGLPVVGQEHLTQQCVESIETTVYDRTQFQLVLVDNGSQPSFDTSSYAGDVFPLTGYRNEANLGFYYPLLQLSQRYPDAELLGLAHNDVLFYENGWDQRLRLAFQSDPKLGLVGLCGSNQADLAGGRGGGTMMRFRGDKGQQQAGERVTELRPAVLLDSLFLMFRRDVIPHLNIDEDISLCHFYDKIWSLRTIEAGYHVAVLGSEIDHLGGQTSTSKAYDDVARAWCEQRGIPVPTSGDLAMYLEAERRFLSEYRDQKRLLPCMVHANYRLWKP